MNTEDKGNVDGASSSRSAAEWFVALDGNRRSAGPDADFAAWLARDPANDAALARCAAALELARQLKSDPELRGTYAEVAEIARRTNAGRRRRAFGAWLERPAVAWSVAGLAVLAAVAGWLRVPAPPAPPSAVTDGRAVAFAALAPRAEGFDPAVLVAGQVVVDARSIALLPFELAEDAQAAGADDARTAAGLYERVVASLAAIPGFYILPPESIEPFAGLPLTPEQIGAQLGVRGIVATRVAIDEQQLRVELRLTDAASRALLLDNEYVRPLEEIDEMQADIVANVALAMSGPRNAGTYDLND